MDTVDSKEEPIQEEGSKDRRFEPRYAVGQFDLRGTLTLLGDPTVYSIKFENISTTGVGVCFLADLPPDQEGRLYTLILASRAGNYVPLQLFFNNMRIPVNIVNHGEGNVFGFCLSKHQRLAELAEKGRQFFQLLVDAAVKRGSTEADFIAHKTVEGETPAPVVAEAKAPEPAVAQAVKSTAPAKPEPKAALRLPDEFKDLPPKHPMGEIIKMRFDAFNRKVFFLRSLGPLIAPFFVSSFIKPDSEMAKVFADNVPLQKKTLYRWVPNEFNLLVGGINKKNTIVVENNFKQALYLLMRAKKKNDVTFDEILALYEGRLPEPLRIIRDGFLTSVCRLIEGEVEKRFKEYHSDASEDNLKAQLLKEEEQLMQNMAPLDLVRKYLWQTIVELGELAQYQKEAARSWVPKEQTSKIAQLGNVVVLSSQSVESIMETTRGKVAGENPLDWFDEIDLRKIYDRTVVVKGEKKKGNFGLFIDNLQPAFKKEILMARVLNSQNFYKYYVLKKSKAYFTKVFDLKAPTMCAFIEDNMLTSIDDGGEYV